MNTRKTRSSPPPALGGREWREGVQTGRISLPPVHLFDLHLYKHCPRGKNYILTLHGPRQIVSDWRLRDFLRNLLRR